MSEHVPRFLKRVIVPVAKPDTVPHMLEIAAALVDPEDENSRVFALTVSIEGSETNERLEYLEPMIADFNARGHHVELVTQIAGSITRGILDGAREHGAEALILGVHKSERRQVKLGSVVENIIEAAPCNVIVYRPGESVGYDHVVVPIDSSSSNLAALRTGVLLAKSHEVPFSPLYIQRDYTYRKDREIQVNAALDLLNPDLVKKEIITGRDPAEKILRLVDHNDLLVLGFSQKSDLGLEFGGDVTNRLMNRAPGPVLIASQILQERGTVTGTLQRQLQRWNPALTQAERNELVWEARKSALPSIDFSMLIILSAALASLGLLLNSAAVIIGAMLVAPLMMPLGALATGLATGQLDITRRAAVTLLQGVLLALIISFIMGSVLPIDKPTAEMIARGNPSLLDAAVALVSGLVAAFALARKEIPVALAGVAIAAALMPPVCTIGLGLSLNNPTLSIGATLLFLANILFIVVAQNMIFLWVGMRPGRRQESQRGFIAWWVLIIGMLAVVLVLIVALSQRAKIETQIEQFLLDHIPGAQAVAMDAQERETGEMDVVLTIRAEDSITAQHVSELQRDLSAHFGRKMNLEVVTLLAVHPRSAFEQQIMNYLLEEIGVDHIESLVITEGDATFFIEATVRARQPIPREVIQLAEETLGQQIERPVRFYLVVQQILTSDPLPEITAETTPEPEAATSGD